MVVVGDLVELIGKVGEYKVFGQVFVVSFGCFGEDLNLAHFLFGWFKFLYE